MSLLTVAAVYFILWWICLFIVLPFGVRTQDEENDTILGTVGSAPLRPMLGRKALAATALAAIVLGVLWFLSVQFDWSLDGASRIFD
jgi:predicted secreted protein